MWGVRGPFPWEGRQWAKLEAECGFSFFSGAGQGSAE